jgi:hypothetical protein
MGESLLGLGYRINNLGVAMNVKRESHVKVLGRWVRVPNWLIVERKRWSAEKISRVEAQAARLGELQTFVMASPLFGAFVVVGAVALMGLGIGWLEHTF